MLGNHAAETCDIFSEPGSCDSVCGFEFPDIAQNIYEISAAFSRLEDLEFSPVVLGDMHFEIIPCVNVRPPDRQLAFGLVPCDDAMLEAKFEISFVETSPVLRDRAMDVDIGVDPETNDLAALLDEIKFLDGANEEEYTEWWMEMLQGVARHGVVEDFDLSSNEDDFG